MVSSKENENGIKHIPFEVERGEWPGSKLSLTLIHSRIEVKVQCFDWKVGREGDHSKVNMQVGKGITMHMAHPFK